MPKTGATRHQRFLKSEKSKTKLKSKKELPKGTNITKTNFKIKKIVLREQLKSHGKTEALSTRKLNIKELLSRLSHFNTNSRTDALDGLRELILLYPEVINQNLAQLINGITPLLLNIEKVVRHESLKVLHCILSNINIEYVEPFFDILSTYLRSAMTHIDSRIQEDSLLFLDLLLQCTPHKMAQHFHKILPNFLDMISKLRIDSKPGRTLTVNLGSQMTTVKWRVKVLNRLQEYLQKFVEYNGINRMETIQANKTFLFDNTKINHFSLYNANYTSVCHTSCFSSKNSQNVELLDEAEKFKEYTDILVPLLYETWLEVCPKANSEQNIETVISEDAASLLRHTLKVFSLIWKIVQNPHRSNLSQNMLNQKHKQQFNQHFMESFPYVTNVRHKQKTVNDSAFEDAVTDPKLVAENLELCYLFVVFNSNINLKFHNNEVISVLNYIEKTLNQITVSGNNNDTVMKIIDTIFSNENSWTKNMSLMDSLFRKIIWIYFNKEISSYFKEQIFKVLCKISLNEKLKHFQSTDVFEMWQKNLPEILLQKSISVETVNMINLFATRKNKTFNLVIKPKLLNIIQNLPSIEISSHESGSLNYHKLFSILYWIKSWDNESLNLLEKQLLDSKYKNGYGKYIFDLLRLRTGV